MNETPQLKPGQPKLARVESFVEKQRRQEGERILRNRNRAVALVLVALVVLFFVITIVKVKF